MKDKKPNQITQSDLSEKDKQDINELLSEGYGFSVKGKDVCLSLKFPDNKEDAGLYLAILLRDENNPAYYQKLARERRLDFLENCLKKTLLAKERGIIRLTLGAYFTGVVKNQTEMQKRLEEYKKRHAPLYGYSNGGRENE